MNADQPIICWFRRDLRIKDNPALKAAADSGRPVVALYILDDAEAEKWAPGGASRWWLHHSLATLARALRERGNALVLRRGDPERVLPALIDETGAGAVHWNRCYEPDTIERDSRIKSALTIAGVEARSFNASLLFEPWTIETKAGGFYKVYTRYWHTCRDRGDPEAPVPTPDRISSPPTELAGDALADWELLPTEPDWAGGLRLRWTPGEAGAEVRLEDFLDGPISRYTDDRNAPGIDGTSNLSPYLHFGDIGPRQVWHRTVSKLGWTPAVEAFLKEIVWREFAYHVFYHLPSLAETPMNEKFQDFPWADDPTALTAWQRGETGYPMVDAGMRELWQTGFMHNRVRMIVGSFLVKHLLLPWQSGEAWFWDTLVDADLAVNSFSWQWIGGCGADAAPYFRIFNPITQGEKFDPKGLYVRTYVPELSRMPDKYLFRPWEAPADVLDAAGVRLGETYPRPIVDHKFARERALEAFKSLPKAAAD